MCQGGRREGWEQEIWGRSTWNHHFPSWLPGWSTNDSHNLQPFQFQIYFPDRVAIPFHNPSLCLSMGCIPESTRKGWTPQGDATGREGALLCIGLVVLCETVMVLPRARATRTLSTCSHIFQSCIKFHQDQRSFHTGNHEFWIRFSEI